MEVCVVKLVVNGTDQDIKVDPDTPLLWAVREQLGLTGTKFGCGAALCGACTVHVDGQAVRSCSTFIGDVEGKTITTIEGMKADDGTLHALQEAWIEHQVPQCGYCQSGQIMSAAALLAETKNPTDAEIESFMAGNICRCGMYSRIKAAIKTAAAKA
jgi:aerobic-type carbon monoxide dehydrogenase small subunit (CoxS/CutS family)